MKSISTTFETLPRIKFNYTKHTADFYPGAISLTDPTSNGSVYIGFQDLVNVHLYDQSVVTNTNRLLSGDNGLISVASSVALNGIPEIEGFSGVVLPFSSTSINPGAGFTPIVEVSRRNDATTDRYIVTYPSGQAILDAYLARYHHRTPVMQEVQQVASIEKKPFIGPVQPILDKKATMDSQSGNGQTKHRKIKQKFVRDLLKDYGGDRKNIELVAKNADYAALAANAYGDDYYPEPTGWTSVRGMQRIRNKKTGDLFYKVSKGPNNQYVLAFQGTNQLKQWFTDNPASVFNVETPIILDAIDVAIKAAKDHPNIVFVGHSLGGRLANIARLVTGKDAITFNSAFSTASELKAGKLVSVPGGRITRFRSPQDPLSAMTPLRGDITVKNMVRVEGTTRLEQLGLDALKAGFNSVGLPEAAILVQPAWEIPRIMTEAKIYTHSMKYLAASMQSAKIVSDWIK